MNISLRLFAPLLVLACGLLGCRYEGDPPEVPMPAAAPMPALETHADSVAMRVFEAYGGPAAWAALPYLGFDFAFQPEGGERQRIRSHFWDRTSGDYRLEWTQGADSNYVVLFNVDNREGTAYLNGEPVAEAAPLLERAYGSFINDTYWLMMPVKLLDPGVNRMYMADSSDAETEVLHLTFGDVGLTPGDQYWVYVDRESGEVERWAYRLQNWDDTRPPQSWNWADMERFETKAGAVRFAARKAGAGRSLLTDHIETPDTAPDGIFTDPQPRR